MIAERALRATALLIAVLAFADPVLTRAVANRTTVVVLPGSAGDRDLASQAVTALESAYDVSRVDVPNAAAYVLAGADVPDGWRPPANARVFAVARSAADLGVRILRVDAPLEVSLDSVVPIDIGLQVDGTGDREVTLALVANGVRVREVKHRVPAQATRADVPLTFVPSQAGLVRLRVEAAMQGRSTAVADRVLEVGSRVWQVLAFDGRPTYPATFVRRALEADPRFKVTTRVVTSLASAIHTNTAPSSLVNPESLTPFDLIVIGAPDALGAPEADSLERYLRDRHGAVLLLPENAEGVVLSRLSGQSAWEEERRVAPVPVKAVGLDSPGNDAGASAEFLWPTRWPPLASALATIDPSPEKAAPTFAVWQMPLGGGRLVVSSATDFWRSRAGAAAGFSAFWRTAAAEAAQATPPVIDVRLSDRLVTPGQWVDLTVAVFSSTEPFARVTGTSISEVAVRLWPADARTTGIGRPWAGAFRAPDQPGRYRLEVSGRAGESGVVEILVAAPDGADEPVLPASERDGLAAMAAAAHRGGVIPVDQIATLPSRLAEVVPATTVQKRWHPMRSVLWLIPFTLCAAGEWWLRRHRGER